MERKYQQILQANQRRVYSIAFHMLANRAEAEDICQEVFERLWRNIRVLSAEEAQAWLVTVTKNCCIDQLRKRHQVHEALPDDLLCDREAYTPEGFLEKAHLSYWLKRAVFRLAEPYRSIIIFLDLQELSVKDAAERIDLSENQIKVYAHRARKMLREQLKNKAL